MNLIRPAHIINSLASGTQKQMKTQRQNAMKKRQVLTHHKKLHVTSSKINVFPAKRQPRKESEREKSFEALTQKSENANSNICDWRKKIHSYDCDCFRITDRFLMEV